MTLPPISRRRRVALAAGGTAVVLAGGLWLARMPIAEGFADRTLARAHVPARYRITAIGLRHQVLEDISIGDPAAPDLVARRVVVHTALGLAGPYVTGIEAEGVRARARIVDGRLSLGAIDRLLPKPDGRPSALPDLALRLADVRVALATSAGPVALALSGTGNPTGRFAGAARVTAARLTSGACTTGPVDGRLTLATTAGAPRLSGPIAATWLACAGVTLADPRIGLDLRLDRGLSSPGGQATLKAGAIVAPGVAGDSVTARIALAGTVARPAGDLALIIARPRSGAVTAREGRFTGRVALGDRPTAEGRVAFADAALAGVAPDPALAAGSPLDPVARVVLPALSRAAARFDASAGLAWRDGVLALDRVAARTASGAALDARGDGGALVRLVDGSVLAGGVATLSGGGLPAMRVVARKKADGRVDGTARMDPIVVPGGRLALDPVAFSGSGDRWGIATRATIDGPVADGRVAGLALPLRVEVGGDSVIANPTCMPLAFDRLEIAGTRFGASRLRLCPIGPAMVRAGPRGVAGGVQVAALRIRGQVGSQPITLAARALRVPIDRPGFVAQDVTVRLGSGDAVTRLDIPTLDGLAGRSGLAGGFTALSGAIARVPLDVTGGQGGWTLAGGVLDLAGRATVSDQAQPPRFEPLLAPDLKLRLAGGRIDVTGTLTHPATGSAVAGATIVHDLRTGTGHATLEVNGLTFTPALQPEMLTRLTLGVIANVAGTVTGQGRIRWNGDGVTSDGDFRTDRIDLAAAFGPVTGISGTIRFDDLLALATPPGQVVRIAGANPGILVQDGVVRYRLLPDTRVRIEGGEWPFAGGRLLLDPGEVDLGRPVARRLTFRVEGMDAAKFVQQFDFDNLAVTGIFDGVLPMVFDQSGGRIEQGRLAVRPGGGRLAYVGEVSNAALGRFGKLAFDALKSIRYTSLVLDLDGRLDGEIVSRVSFDGTNTAPRRARKGMLAPLMNLPLRFNIIIRAPFRGLLNSARALNDPRGLIGQSIRPDVQTPESEPVR